MIELQLEIIIFQIILSVQENRRIWSVRERNTL